MIDLEAEAVSGFIKNLLFAEAGRARPSFRDCATDPQYDALCGSPSNNASFPSGHTVNIATSAGLVCVHHHYLPIYGQPDADAGICALMSAATVATAVTRHVRSTLRHGLDRRRRARFRHGYGLPWLLHYRAGAAARPGAATTTARHVPCCFRLRAATASASACSGRCDDLEDLLDDVRTVRPATCRSRRPVTDSRRRTFLRRTEARDGAKIRTARRAVVANPLEGHVDESAVVGLERDAEIQLDRAVSALHRPVVAARQHLSPKPVALERAAADRNVTRTPWVRRRRPGWAPNPDDASSGDAIVSRSSTRGNHAHGNLRPARGIASIPR